MMQVDRSGESHAPPPRTPTERGWSLEFMRPGSLAAVLTGALFLLAVAPTVASASDYDPGADQNSMANTTQLTGARDWWAAGYTGRGVDVALIDTGVAPVKGLDARNKIIYGPDLSLESQSSDLRNLDTNGHGTFMAGLIAGRDSSFGSDYADAPPSQYLGMAPDARIVSLKVGVADGGVDVSQVIAAIDWVVQHKNDNGLNIRILNLSYGTNSQQSYLTDPLAFAVEQAWQAGIVVVAASGNTGYQVGGDAPGLADPAYDPFIIAVGGYNAMGTPSTDDDVVGPYSASGKGCNWLCRAPDFVADGSHLQGLRVPNGFVDMNNPAGQLGNRYFRGSGTSEAAAVASGSIALLLQKNPQMSPDQVKRFITNNGVRPTLDNLWTPKVAGAGEIDLTTLLAKGRGPSRATQFFKPSSGTGSLDASRGSDRLTDHGVVLSGEQDIFGEPFDSAAMAELESDGSSWSGGTWNGSVWTGSSWSGSSWSGSSWSGSSWSGNSWSGNSWSGSSWSGSSWSGNSWSGDCWASGDWG
jgi:serine protease AprX